MTSSEKQIDLLMRRYAKAATRTSLTEHLDADELSAFAEGALPEATRSRYVSHLADCDGCRKQASDLAISSGTIVRAEQAHPEISEGRTFWQALAGLFALPVLRYAAFAAVLLIVAGVAFVALRRPRDRDSSLIALNEPVNQQRETAIKPSTGAREGITENKQANTATTSSSPPQFLPGTDQNPKRDETRVAENVPVNPLLMKEAPAPLTAEKKAGDTEVAKAAPSYAPPPPGEITLSQQQQKLSREQQGAGISGPRQQQKMESLDKVAQERERDAAKDVARSDDTARKSAPQSVASTQPGSSRRAADEKAKGPMRNMENAANRNENAGRADSPKKSTGGEDRASAEEAQTRSAGGRKFRRQGNAWVDQKFKSSMTLKGISRGSNEYAALDAGLRSIAQQLGGEVIVVWKDRAYLIR
jgi:putative zinc finger protein